VEELTPTLHRENMPSGKKKLVNKSEPLTKKRIMPELMFLTAVCAIHLDHHIL